MPETYIHIPLYALAIITWIQYYIKINMLYKTIIVILMPYSNNSKSPEKLIGFILKCRCKVVYCLDRFIRVLDNRFRIYR